MLVAAAGRARCVTAAMVKPGAVVVDVGSNRSTEGRVAGDVDLADVRRVPSRVTPLPGGVATIAIIMPLKNTLRAAERASSAAA
jgi:methylenetetrahydrofolate dehydrogenase (NADP+)/methenyltetrahydrofolate cyclohydrolase